MYARHGAVGPGALGVRIGGPGVYHGHSRWRPRFDAGAGPGPAAIGRAVRLDQNGALAWMAIAPAAGYAIA